LTRRRLPRSLTVALSFLALSAAFQARGLSRDWLLSEASILKNYPLWATHGVTGRRPRWLPDVDYVRYYAPYAAFIQRELRAGHLPLWNPYIATGVPVVESAQPALFFPLTLLLLPLPFEHAITVMAIVRVAVGGAGTFALARVLGCRLAEAALAGALFMLSPFHLTFRFNSIDNVAPLLPLLLAVSELTLRGASLRRCGAAWSLLATLMFLGGHPETAVHALGVAWIYHLLRAALPGPRPERARRTLRAVVFLGSCTALAALGAAVALWGQIAMILDWHASEVRGAFRYRRLPPVHLLSFLLPSFFGASLRAYVGTVALVLALGGAVGRGSPFPAWPWLVIGGGPLLAAYGLWPVAPVLEALPLLRLANHVWLIWMVHLALAILAARGLRTLGSSATRLAMTVAVALYALALIVLATRGFPGLLPGFARPELRLVLRPAVCLALTGIVIMTARSLAKGRTGAWLVAGLVIADVYTAWARSPRPWSAAFPPPPPVLSLVADPPGSSRTYLPDELMPLDANMVYGLPAIGAYDPTISRRTLTLLHLAGLRSFLDHGASAPEEVQPEGLRLLSLLNVRHVIVGSPLTDPVLGARLKEVSRGPLAVYRNPGALPRVFAVERARVAATPDEALAFLQDPTVDLAREVILEEPVEQPVPAARGAPGRDGVPEARMLDYGPGRARIAAETSHGGYLVFSETFTPGWHATVDGEPAAVLRGDYALTTVPLPPGRHEVILFYRPLAVVLGSAATGLTTLVLLAALLPARSRRDDPT
jgi:hypothetical protein